MAHQFKTHYTREEANALLPQLRVWLDRLSELRGLLEKYDKRVSGMMSEGADLGGDAVNKWIRTVAETQGVLQEFHQREIMIKDIDRGLLDFPAIIGGREVFLCWEKDEDSVEHWHDLEAGYAGRERIE